MRIVHNFGYDEATVCRLASDGSLLSPRDALEGVRYGWYECHLPSSPPPIERTSRYDQDRSAVGAAVGIAGLFTILAVIFGK